MVAANGALAAGPDGAPLPPQVSRSTFDSALDALRAIVGPRNVFSDSDQLVGYNDHFAMKPPEEHAPSGAVAPTSVDQIQRVLAVVREHGIPVWTISTGRNLGYGGAAPRMYNASNTGAQLCGESETVILDLSRLDRVLEVDVDNGYARVEPGVSYAALSAYLAEHGHALQVDSERDGAASIAGSTFAKGIGYTPYGEHALVQCGAEFATPYGELVRTGMSP